MEKILDQLLMPPPPSTTLQLGISQFNSQDSPREFAGLNLDRSHNSSSTTNSSSNCSWLSESSCGCHSPRINQNKSSLVFYRRPILPPMLCSASRSEMQLYRNKAIEKEQKRKMKSKRNLLSRVEAILSSVEIESDSTKETPSASTESENIIMESMESTDKSEINTELKDNNSHPSIHSDHSESSKPYKFQEKQDSSPQCDTPAEKSNDQSTNSSCIPSSGEEEKEFREDAYRRSLQNLLQKSMTESLNTSQIIEATTTNKAISSASSSTETNNWAENTLATVVPNDDLSPSLATRYDDNESDTTTTASYLVDSILDEVRKDLSIFSTSHIPIHTHSVESDLSLSEHSSHKSCDLSQGVVVLPQVSLPQVAGDNQKLPLLTVENQSTLRLNESDQNSPKPTENNQILPGRNQCEIKPTENNHKFPGNNQYDIKPAEYNPELPIFARTNHEEIEPAEKEQNLQNEDRRLIPQTTNLSTATDRINDALLLINTKLTCVSPRNTSSSEHSTSYNATLGSLHDVSVNSVTPETNNLMKSYKNILEKMEDEHSCEEIINSCGDFTADEAPNSAERNEEQEENEESGRKRVRSDSYCIEAPSPLLVSSRDSHTIHSIQGDTDTCSETISLVSHDVKRRLEMPSDSEDSIVSGQNKGYSLTQRERSLKNRGYDVSNNNTKFSDGEISHGHYKVIEEQHRKELMELQSQHEKQLLLLKQQLVQSEPSLASSIETIENMSFNDLKMNKSTDQGMDEVMHKKWCKLSALIKGYLTRRLLQSRPVQNIMQTIRDTSRTILSIKNEGNPNSKNDATLMQRLFLQLEAALYEFHETFFDKSIGERISIIARSQLAETIEKNRLKPESSAVIPQQRLSAATLKSMERKRLERKSQSVTTKIPPKNVKSKISYIWKDDKPKKGTTKQQQPQNLDRKKTLKNSVSGRPLLNKNILASYTMSPVVR